MPLEILKNKIQKEISQPMDLADKFAYLMGLYEAAQYQLLDNAKLVICRHWVIPKE